jgi:phosphate transport system protein
MSVHFQHDLEKLQSHLVARASFVEESVEKAIESLRNRDVILAKEVLAGDSQLAETDGYVEEECVRLLALQQPLASDLRRVIVTMKIDTDLDRMAELAVNIAERVLSLAGLPPVPELVQLPQMTELTVQMVRQSLEAFVSRDVALARSIIKMDDNVDHLNGEIITVLIRGMEDGAEHIPGCLSFFSAVRHLERIADYATKIAENVVYLVEGEMIHYKLGHTNTNNLAVEAEPL